MPLFEMRGGKGLADDMKVIPGAKKPPDTNGSDFQGCREGSFKTVGGGGGVCLAMLHMRCQPSPVSKCFRVYFLVLQLGSQVHRVRCS